MSFTLKNLEFEGSTPDISSVAIHYSTLVLRYLQAKSATHNAGNTKKASFSQVRKQFLTGNTIKDGLTVVSNYLKEREDGGERELVATIEQNGRQFEIVARKNAVLSPLKDKSFLSLLDGVNLDFAVSELYLDDKPESLLEILL